MIAILRIAFLSLLFLSPSLALAQEKSSSYDSDLERFIVATQFAPSFKYGIRQAINAQGSSNPKLERALALPDDKIVEAVLPIFKEHLSPSEARAIADFYSTATGRLIVKQQAAQIETSAPSIRLPPAQRLEYERFAASAAGIALKRLDQFQKSEAFWQQVGAVMDALTQE